MRYQQTGIILWQQNGPSINEVANHCGLHPAMVRRLAMLGVIEPLDHNAYRFAPEVMLKIQRICRLRRDLGIPYSTMALVLDLLDRIEALEARLN